MQAVQALNPEQAAQQQSELEEIARTDCDLAVRRAALKHILNPDALVTLLDEDEFADEVAQQIAQRIKAGHSATCHAHECVLDARIALAEEADLEALLPLLSTPDQCTELALRLRDPARQRLLEHPQLNTESGLNVLQRAARGKDKTLHRHARQRLDAIKATHAQCADALSRLGELDTAIDRTLKIHPAEAEAVISHRQKLAKLRSMRNAVVEELDSAARVLEEAGGDIHHFPVPADPLRDVDLALPDPNNNPFKNLTSEFEALSSSMRDGALLADARAQRDALADAWLSHSDTFPPSREQQQIFQRVTKQFQAYHDAWQRLDDLEGAAEVAPEELTDAPAMGAHTGEALQTRVRWRKQWRQKIDTLQWPHQHTAPSILSQAHTHLQRVTQEIESLQAVIARAETELETTVSKAADAVDDGQVDAAKKHLKRARALQKAGLKSHDRELASVSARVAEFDDWQHFATDPKRHQLLAELQPLCDQPLDAPEQASRLKALRQSWQQLGRPSGREEIELQQEFDRLAAIAFEPCSIYYDEQAKARAANLARREALCEQLQAYLSGTDWAHADMQAAETILRSARDEWHANHPCERKALRPVQKRFEALQDQLYGKVKSAWDENLERKQEIVEQAKALLDEDVETQVNGAKSLQQQWQRVGKTPRGPDQKLWREFRQTCDQIFTQREAHHQAQQEAVQQGIKALDEAIDALVQSASEPNPTRKQFDQLSANIQQASEGLRVGADQRKRIRQGEERYHAALGNAARAQTEAELTQWQHWDQQVSEAESNDTEIDPPHPVFAARIAGDPQQEDYLALVLEAEIAADLASPSEDQAARMSLQVELMNAGRRDLASEDYRDLMKRWCRAGPKTDLDSGLRTRFFEALATRL